MDDFNNSNYIVYVKIDQNNNIIDINSSAFVPFEWGIKIDEGTGDKYHHAQNYYFPESIYTSDKIPKYKLINGIPIERTLEEIETDRAQTIIQKPQPTIEELNAKIAALTESNQFLEDCLVEMATIVYA